MPITQRKANLTDLNFISGCMLYGARKGSYSFNPDNPLTVKSMKQEMQSIVHRGILLDQREAIARVFSIDNKRAGLLIICDSSLPGCGLEIYALSVALKYQGKGYASYILDCFLSENPYMAVTARCSSSSEKMYSLLSRRGFEMLGVDSDFRVLQRAVLDRNDRLEPVYLRA